MAQIKKLSDGKYLVRVSQGTGKTRRYINKTIRGKLSDAQKFAREKETLLDLGYAPSEIKLTFDEYFKKWIKGITGTVAPRTLGGYQSYIESYALPSLCALKLSDIRTHHIQSIYDGMSGRGLSATTVRNLKAALSACFNYAIKKEYRRTNPCKNCDLPNRNEKEKVVLDYDEARRFIDACGRCKNGIIFETALETGMRPEEYLALRWRDIDFRGNAVSIKQIVSFHRKTGTGFYFAEPKTKKSRRLIPISQTLRDKLMQHRIEQNEYRLSIPTSYAALDLVFGNEVGNPFELTNLIRRYFKPLLKEAGITKNITTYSLRHSCASLLLASGENPKVVQERLGHASVIQTLDTYSHLLSGIQEKATEKLDNILRFKAM